MIRWMFDTHVFFFNICKRSIETLQFPTEFQGHQTFFSKYSFFLCKLMFWLFHYAELGFVIKILYFLTINMYIQFQYRLKRQPSYFSWIIISYLLCYKYSPHFGVGSYTYVCNPRIKHKVGVRSLPRPSRIGSP